MLFNFAVPSSGNFSCFFFRNSVYVASNYLILILTNRQQEYTDSFHISPN